MHHDFADLAARLGCPARPTPTSCACRLSDIIGSPVELRRVPPAPGRACGTSYAHLGRHPGHRVHRARQPAARTPQRAARDRALPHSATWTCADHPQLSHRFSLLDPAAVARVFQRAPGAPPGRGRAGRRSLRHLRLAPYIASCPRPSRRRTGRRPGRRRPRRARQMAGRLARPGPAVAAWSTAACPEVVMPDRPTGRSGRRGLGRDVGRPGVPAGPPRRGDLRRAGHPHPALRPRASPRGPRRRQQSEHAAYRRRRPGGWCKPRPSPPAPAVLPIRSPPCASGPRSCRRPHTDPIPAPRQGS